MIFENSLSLHPNKRLHDAVSILRGGVECLLTLRHREGICCQPEEQYLTYFVKKNAILKASASFSIRAPRHSGKLRIRDLVNHPDRWIGERIFLQGRNAGWHPDPNCPFCAGGPPVTRSDWVLRDDTGCLYVTGKWAPPHAQGQEVLVEGTLRRGRRGQIYIEAKQVLPASLP